jgi:farnesyl-diphosphate farnesyltransferase
MDERDLLTGLLRNVSRSFYLTLRVLPRSVRSQIGVAYLLARATDTIADTTIVPVDQRLDALEKLRCHIAGRSPAAPDLSVFATLDETPEAGPLARIGLASPAERTLLRRIGEVLLVLSQFSTADQDLVRTVLDTITTGQLLDLQRFGQPHPGKILALDTDADLDRYLYLVAGCVGEFWTRICRAHIFPRANVDEPFLLQAGVRYGKGLQLTNILRDLPADLRLGRCYLPMSHLRAHGIEPGELLETNCDQRCASLLDPYFALANDYLRDGWAYTNRIPRSCARIRLACAWPILIGKRTLDLVRAGPALGPDRTVKVTRKVVRMLIAKSILAYPWPRLWEAQWREGG